MKLIHNPSRSGGIPSLLFAILSLGLLLSSSRALAQRVTPASAEPNKEEEVLQLSPFVVPSAQDNGYAATNSLSGTRLKTPLVDIASQVEVLTKDFLDDIAATTIEEALAYSTNTETSLNFAGEGANDTRGLNSETRIRGLGAVTKLRGLFRTQIDADTYNTERLSLSSGPNSILFGLGNAGGTLDSSVARASLTRSSQSVSYRLDNNGSQRLSLDINQPIIKNKAGFRLAMLNSERDYDRKPSGDTDRRLYGTITLRPFRNTEIRYHSEWQNAGGTRTTPNLARDAVTPWLRGIDGIEGTADDRPLFNNSVNSTVPTTLANIFSSNNGTGGTYTYGNTAGTPGIFLYGTKVTTNGPQLAAGTLSYDAFARSFNRPDIIPQKGNNIWGLNRRDEIRAHAQNIYLEQKIVNDLSLELAYARETYNTRSGGFVGQASGAAVVDIEVDANQFIRTPAGVVTPNPNAGRLYIEETPQNGVSRSLYHEYRATLAYLLDLTKRKNWMRWFGRHSVALVYSDAITQDVSGNFRRVVGGAPSWTSAPIADSSTSRRFTVRHYFDAVGSSSNQGRYFMPSLGGGDVLATSYITDPATGATLPVYAFDRPNGGQSASSGKRQSIESKVLGLQSYLFGERLILSGGLRNDKVRNADLMSLENPALNVNAVDPATGFYPRYDTLGYKSYNFYEGKTTNSYGVVLHPFLTTPYLSKIRLHFSHSANYKVNESGTLGPFGEVVPTGVGVGEDYGFSVTSDKVSVRVNFFTNTQENNRPPNEFNAARRSLLNIEEQVINVNAAAGIATPLEGVDIKAFGQDKYAGTSDYFSKGIDITLQAQPITGLKLAVSVGRAKATDSNIMLSWLHWANARLPLWQKVAGGGWEVVTMAPRLGGANGNKTIRQYFLDAWESVYAPISAQSGRDRSNSREWRANMHADYAIQSGFLKGWSIGGGGRWQSANVIGYGVTTISSQTVIDLKQPVAGASTLSIDANLTYRMKGVPFVSDKHRTRFQLNARNLLDDGDLVTTRALTNGGSGVLAFKPERQIIASVTLDF